MTQYDTKTLLFTVDSEDIGQKVTGLAEGAIESMHNLPVSVVGSKITHGVNGSEAATMKFQNLQVELMALRLQ